MFRYSHTLLAVVVFIKWFAYFTTVLAVPEMVHVGTPRVLQKPVRINTRNTAMKTPAVALTVSLLLCSLSVGISSGNDTDTNCPPATVTRDDTMFEIVHYRHGRSGVSFENDAHVWSSEYIFNKAGYVATITAGSEEYKVEYDDQGDVEDVRRVDYGSRALAGEGDNAEDASERAAMMRRHLTETCEDCEKAWDTVCGDGLTSLCYLEEGYGSVFGPMATESIETMCSTFWSACAGTSAGDVCEDRRDGYDDDSGSSISSSSSDDSDSSSNSSDSSSDDSDSSSDSGSSDSSSSSSDSSSSDSSSSDSSSDDSDSSSSDSSSGDSDSSSSDDSDSGGDDGGSSDDSGGDDADGGIGENKGSNDYAWDVFGIKAGCTMVAALCVT